MLYLVQPADEKDSQRIPKKKPIMRCAGRQVLHTCVRLSRIRQASEHCRQFFRLPRFRNKGADAEFGQLSGNFVLVTDGNENDFNLRIELFYCLCQTDAAVLLRPQLQLGHQHIAALSLGKRKGRVRSLKAMQLRVR